VSLGAFLARHLPRDSVSDDDLWDLYRKYVRPATSEKGLRTARVTALRCAPLVASISCALMRTRLPALRTGPGSYQEEPKVR
jgi:hypothetical protein